MNNNGYISFGVESLEILPPPFPMIPLALIAPFWADADTRCGGLVYYRETTANSILAKVANDVQSSLSLLNDFYPSSVVIATWHQVGYFDCVDSLDNKVRIRDTYRKCQLIYNHHPRC